MFSCSFSHTSYQASFSFTSNSIFSFLKVLIVYFSYLISREVSSNSLSLDQNSSILLHKFWIDFSWISSLTHCSVLVLEYSLSSFFSYLLLLYFSSTFSINSSVTFSSSSFSLLIISFLALISLANPHFISSLCFSC